ncbi:MAG: bacterioferritin [Chromatiaceae bacterium]|nr:bacterioferritin [Chromatiaceae bacterium]MCP5313890.1 bacterioferritin [Chromatiaceae bacterium]
MQGDPQVVQGLNLCLKDQLTAINQLFLHARMARDWGLREFDAYEYKRSIKAMKMADVLIERVLFLEGLPNMQDSGKLLIGENIPEMLHGDLQLLNAIRCNQQETIQLCEQARDFVSRDQLQEMLEETEEHIDWVETQQYLIANVGLENYLQSQMGD